MPYFGSELNNIAPDVNWTPARQVYPGADGGTIATAAAAGSPDSYTTSKAQTSSRVIQTPGAARGLMWWVGIGILVVLMVFAARKTGQAEEFKNLRASTYNIAFITFVAILGITALKIIAVKTQNLPGLSGFSAVVLAA